MHLMQSFWKLFQNSASVFFVCEVGSHLPLRENCSEIPLQFFFSSFFLGGGGGGSVRSNTVKWCEKVQMKI